MQDPSPLVHPVSPVHPEGPLPISAVQVGIFRTDGEGNCCYVNQYWCKMTGLRFEEALGMGWIRGIHPEDRERFRRDGLVSLQRHGDYLTEFRFLHPDGRVIWAQAEVVAERHDSGQIQGYVGTVIDITRQKQAENILRRIVVGTAETTGSDFFPALVCHLAEALQVQHALVTERVGDKLQTLGLWSWGQYQASLIYDPVSTPCEITLGRGAYHCGRNLQEQFPQDLILTEMGAESYLGITLKDSRGQTIGTLCILDTQPLLLDRLTHGWAILKVFAARAAAELQRKVAIDALHCLNQELEERVAQRTQALEERESRYRALMNQASDAILLADSLGYILEGNHKAEELLGYGQEELRQLHFTQLHPPEVLEKTRQHFKMSGTPNQNACPLETLILRKDGGQIPVDITCSEITIDGESIRQGIFRDIRERKAAEKSLLASKQFIQTVINTVPLPMFWKDTSSVFFGCNNQMARQLGMVSTTEIFGKTDFDLFTTEVEAIAHRASDQQVIVSGEPILGMEQTHLRANGETRIIEIHKAPLRDLEGQIIGIVGMFQDITDRKEYEKQLETTNQKLSQATRLKDEFLANMSHELRTPLNAILGMTEGLKDNVFGPINSEQLEAVETIERSGHHLLTLINDILDLAKIEAGQIHLDCVPTSVAQLCQTSLSFIKAQAFQKKLQVSLKLPPTLPNIMVDERRMRQALINLLSNAVKFTPEEGQITLEVAMHEEEPPRSPSLRFAICDTGIGIAPEHFDQLFQQFFQVESYLTRQYQGSGLGLALVKCIVELHGGSIGVTSELGRGSCFTIDLPDSTLVLNGLSPTPDLVVDLETHHPSPNGTHRILIAEDNEANISTLSSYLQTKGYEVLIARNGKEAIALAQAEQPDLILMDIQMPGMDGLEATQRIRQRPELEKIPILALTALAMEGDRDRCLAAGVSDYFPKPMKLKQLVLKIEEFLNP